MLSVGSLKLVVFVSKPLAVIGSWHAVVLGDVLSVFPGLHARL